MAGVTGKRETYRRTILRKTSAFISVCSKISGWNNSLVFVLGLLLVGVASAQDREEIQFPSKTDTLQVFGQGPFLIRPFLISGSVSVRIADRQLTESEYSIDYRRGFIELPDVESGQELQLIISYKYIPIELATSIRLWPLVQYPSADKGKQVSPSPVTSRSVAAFSPNRLHSSGSITRGLSTGTGQSVGIESGLRIQVDGEILDGLFLRAALTDENTPILPQGTTRQLNDFDRVFIELKSSRGTLQLGDFDSRIDGGRFGRLYRKQQGVMATGSISAENGIFNTATVRISGAVSRGIFRTQRIQAIDRVQGPYRLEGQNGERFIIVIPGSESVYLNGERLTRGETEDFVIDYETGEITFTPQRIIGVDSRITAEFEYTTSQFTRTMLAADVTSSFGRIVDGSERFSFGATLLRETDGEEFSNEFGLTEKDIENIERAGDDLAFKGGAIPVIYDPEASFTQYLIEQRFDADNEPVNIFVAITTTPPDTSVVFRVSFTRLGTNRGSYKRTGLSTNGIAFEYVGSDMADYEPIQILPSPVLQQLIDFRGQLRPFSKFRISGEWAASVNDLNRLSDLDNADNSGNAYDIRVLVDPFNLEIAGRSLGALNGAVSRRFRSESFRTFSRTRPIEFTRDWNIRGRQIDVPGGVQGTERELESEVRMGLDWSDSSSVSASLSSIRLSESFDGSRATGSLTIRRSAATQASFGIQYIDTIDRTIEQTGTWLRQQGRLSYGFFSDQIRPFISVERENLEQRDLNSGVLLAPSTKFLETRAGIVFSKNHFSVQAEIKNREEDIVITPGLRQPFDALTVMTSGTYDPSRLFHLGANAGFRKTRGSALSEAILPSAESDGSLLIGINGRWRKPSAGLNLNWFYQAQSERSTVLQEIYIRTGQDRGQFVWVDDNKDGVAQLEEFIPETTPDEGQYVRSFLPSDDFEEITTAKARVRFEYRPRSGSASSGTSGFRRFLSGLGWVTLVDVEERSRDPVRQNLYLLRLHTFRSQKYTLNGRVRVRQEISVFRNHPQLSVDIALQETQSLSELSAGIETLQNQIAQIRGRYRFSNDFTGGISGELTRNNVSSQSFDSRNYDIRMQRIDPFVSWNASPGLVMTVNSTFSFKQDKQSDLRATMIQIPVQARAQLQQRLDLLARFEVANIEVNGPVSGILAYEMTDGRGPGRSTLWRVTIQSNLTDVLTAIASYDGRNPSNAPTIHTARFQLSARF